MGLSAPQVAVIGAVVWWVLVSGAWAAPDCPDVIELIQQAHASFDDAEVDGARQRLDSANRALGCQSQVVPRAALIELYHLDALASMAAEDRRAAQYAIIRAVSVDPDAAPPADAGPELLEVHATWSVRLRQTKLVIRPELGYRLFVDGTEAPANGLTVVSGEHLVQVEREGVWSSGVAELVEGRPGPAGTAVTPAPVVAAPVSGETKLPSPKPPPRVRIGWALAASSLMLAGGAALAGGTVMEQSFTKSAYDDPEYDGCSRPQPCWSTARAEQIRADASRINLTYGVGYGLVAAGAGILGVEVLVFHDGAGVRLRGRW